MITVARSQPLNPLAAAAPASIESQAPAAPELDATALDKQYQETAGRIGKSLEQGKALFREVLDNAKYAEQPTLLKSRTLCRAFTAVVGLIERTLHLEKGRLTGALLKDGPVVVRTERALAGSKAVLAKMEEVNGLLEQRPDLSKAEHKQQLGQKLDELDRAIVQFHRSIDVGGLNEADAERMGVFADKALAALELVDEMNIELARQPTTEAAPAPLPPAVPLDSLGFDDDPWWSDPSGGHLAAPESLTADEREQVAAVAEDVKASLESMQSSVDANAPTGAQAEPQAQEVQDSVNAEIDKFDQYIEELTAEEAKQPQPETSAPAPRTTEAAETERLQQELSAAGNALVRGATSSQSSNQGVFARFKSKVAGFFGRKTHFHGRATPGKPAAGNAFYHERQKARLCLKHSMNAFLGGEVFTDETLAASVRNQQLKHYRQEIADDPAKVAADWADTIKVEGGLTADWVAANPEAMAEQLTDAHFQVFAQGQSLVNYVRGGNEVGVGVTALRDRAEELGLPEPVVRDFRAGEQQDMVDYLHETEQRVDRMVVGNMGHFMAFRKNAQGQWFLLDSTKSSQRPLSPSEFVQRRPIAATRYKQYQFLTFNGPEFVPNLNPRPKAPMGVDFV